MATFFGNLLGTLQNTFSIGKNSKKKTITVTDAELQFDTRLRTEGEVIQKIITTPSTPDANYVKIYPKSNGKIYKLTSDGIEREITNVDYFNTVAQAEAATGYNTNDVIYVYERKSFYYYNTGSAYTRDGDLVLNTGSGGNTRWIMTAKISRTQGETGWINTDNIVFSMVNTTTARINLSTDGLIAIKGIRHVVAAGNYDVVISGAAGLKYVYFDESSIPNLAFQTKLWNFETQVPVMLIYWSGTAIIAAPQTELHGIRDTVWHQWVHRYLGAQYNSGMTFTTNTQLDNNNNPPDSTVQYVWSTTGIIQDEDAVINIGTGNWNQTLGSGLTSTDAAIFNFLYYNGAAITTLNAMSDRTPFIHAGGNTTPQWNNNGALTASISGNYVVYHYFASPMTGGYSIFSRPHNAVYTTLAAAQAARPSQLTWTDYAEVKHLYSIVFRVNTAWTNATHRCKIVSVQDFRLVAGSPVAGISATDHNALSNRNSIGSHPINSIYGFTDGGLPLHSTTSNGLIEDSDLNYNVTNKSLRIKKVSASTDGVTGLSLTKADMITPLVVFDTTNNNTSFYINNVEAVRYRGDNNLDYMRDITRYYSSVKTADTIGDLREIYDSVTGVFKQEKCIGVGASKGVGTWYNFNEWGTGYIKQSGLLQYRQTNISRQKCYRIAQFPYTSTSAATTESLEITIQNSAEYGRPATMRVSLSFDNNAVYCGVNFYDGIVTNYSPYIRAYDDAGTVSVYVYFPNYNDHCILNMSYRSFTPEWTDMGTDSYVPVGALVWDGKDQDNRKLPIYGKLAVTYNVTDLTSNAISADNTSNISINGSYYNKTMYCNSNKIVATGITDGGYLQGINTATFRPNNVTDLGTLANLYGHSLQFGHYGTGSAGRTTTSAYGLYIQPYNQSGTIGSLYDLYIATISGTGTTTNHYGIYQNDTTIKNFFGSDTGIGIATPNTILHIHRPNPNATNLMITNSSTGSNATDGVLIGIDATGNAQIKQQENLDLSIYTNNTERILVKNTGLVGIGTNNPKSTLHVNGGVKIGDDLDAANIDKVGTLRYYESGNNSYLQICVRTGASSYQWQNVLANSW